MTSLPAHDGARSAHDAVVDPRIAYPAAVAPARPVADVDADVARVLDWFTHAGRDLPWRRVSDPWPVLVSEVMLQQTPVARVLPVWETWMARWPRPDDLAAASPADVLAAWDRLGYPRRALRLRECAIALVQRHGGRIPQEEDALRALPGIGTYTAAAVRAFAFGRRAVVVDVNVRRVLARWLGGLALQPPHAGAREWLLADAVAPADDAEGVAWAVASMELGALVCRARSPRCDRCPLVSTCAWVAAGRPADAAAGRRRAQGYEGTDRQQRGIALRVLREAHAARSDAAGGWVPLGVLTAAMDPERADRIVAELEGEGLLETDPDGLRARLPGGPRPAP